eukprot:gene23096-biopygen11800
MGKRWGEYRGWENSPQRDGESWGKEASGKKAGGSSCVPRARVRLRRRRVRRRRVLREPLMPGVTGRWRGRGADYRVPRRRPGTKGRGGPPLGARRAASAVVNTLHDPDAAISARCWPHRARPQANPRETAGAADGFADPPFADAQGRAGSRQKHRFGFASVERAGNAEPGGVAAWAGLQPGRGCSLGGVAAWAGLQPGRSKYLIAGGGVVGLYFGSKLDNNNPRSTPGCGVVPGLRAPPQPYRPATVPVHPRREEFGFAD